MFNTSVAVARFRMPSWAVVEHGIDMSAAGCSRTAQSAAATAYTPALVARNGAKGGVSAWSPPI